MCLEFYFIINIIAYKKLLHSGLEIQGLLKGQPPFYLAGRNEYIPFFVAAQLASRHMLFNNVQFTNEISKELMVFTAL